MTFGLVWGRIKAVKLTSLTRTSSLHQLKQTSCLHCL